MTPIFFPSTWIPKSDLGLLLACFKQVVLFQPARKLVPERFLRLEAAGRLDIRLPDEGSGEGADEKRVDDLPNLLGAYHAWADLHRGEHPAFYRFSELHSRDPDDASTAWIRSKIRGPEREKTGGKSRDGSEALLLRARLFLAIAQEYDQQDESLSGYLHAIDNMERRMLRDLSPDQPSSTAITAGTPLAAEVEAGRPMPAHRLEAWRRLYSHFRRAGNLPPQTSSPFFVTGDQEALRSVLDSADTAEVVCRIVRIPYAAEKKPFVETAVHQKICDVLNAAAQDDNFSAAPTISFSEKACSDRTGALIIYRGKGNLLPAAPPGSGSVPQPAERFPAGGNKPDTPSCTLLGHLLKNCTLDSPK